MESDMSAIFKVCVLSCVIFSRAQGTGSSCEDIDEQACISMGKQSPNMCSETVLSHTACPKYCGNCPTTCFSCNTTSPDVSSCNTETCDQDKQCMLKTVTSTRNGKTTYVLGCAKESVCDNGRKGTLQSHSVAFDCCTSDLCNNPSLTTLSTYQRTTPRQTTTRPTTTRPTTRQTTTRPTTRQTTTRPTTRQSTTRSTTKATTHKTYTTPTSAPLPVCARDIIVYSDNSIGFPIRLFLFHLLHLPIGTGIHDSEVALATFDSELHEKWNLNTHTTHGSLNSAIIYGNIYNWTSGTPDITVPFKHLIHKYAWTILGTQKYGLRPNVPKVVIFVTGRFRSSYLLDVINYQTNIYLHKHFSNIITVGVGNVDHQVLDVIATENHSLYVSSANELRDLDLGRKLLNLVCI